MNVGIIGVGKYLPKKVRTNFDLEKMVDTSDEWIRTRTGIRERRIADPSEATSDMAYKAAKQALKRAKLNAKKLELIIIATISSDMPFPATACVVQEKLGAKGAVVFDISAACAGFVFALDVAHNAIASGRYKNALVVGAELISRFVDWSDRSTCVLFGDGAGAAVLAPVKRGGIVSSVLACDGAKAHLLNIPAGGSRLPASHDTVTQRLHYLKMQGNEIFKFAVRSMVDSTKKAISKAGIKVQDIDCVIPHQANLRIIDALLKRLQILFIDPLLILLVADFNAFCLVLIDVNATQKTVS